jgi:hypothetical protein
MGGYATKEAGTTAVLRQDIPKVIELVSKFSSVPVEDLHPLGSTGKAPWSSDVDLAINRNVFDPEMVKQSMSLAGPYILSFKDMSGLGVQSYAIDVDGRAVQVDLMFVDNLEWAKFAYWSPAAVESNYKGAVRTMLLMGIAANTSVAGYDGFYYVDNQLVGRIGRTFDLNRGLRRIFQYRPKRKDGNGYLKSMKTVDTVEEVEEAIGSDMLMVTYRNPDITFDNPLQALAIMFKRPIYPGHVEDAESVIRLIRTSFTEWEQEEIFKKTAERAKSVVGKMKLPQEIVRYL